MAQGAGLRHNFPTFYLMAEPLRWVFRSRRRVWCAVLILLSIVTAPPLWWATQLLGLPDIGDPFDVEAFRAMSIPDERNAFVLYRQAAALVTPLNSFGNSASLHVDPQSRWSTVGPEVRRWTEANREALALYRRGAERPEAFESPLTSSGRRGAEFDALRPVHRLILMALLEASRLDEQGDMSGAWDWYRAVLRTIHHVGQHGTYL